MKKFILIVIICFLICGCSSKYNLEFNGKEFKENINFSLNKNTVYDDMGTGLEIANEKYYALEGKEYKKTVKEVNDMLDVNLSYVYDKNGYLGSYFLKSCINKKSFYEDKNNYYLNLSGKFYCLYSDKLEINITTDRKVLKHNASLVKGNTYTWVIDDKNKDNVDIMMTLSKNKINIKNLIKIVTIIGVSLFMIVVIYFINKMMNYKKVNEI